MMSDNADDWTVWSDGDDSESSSSGSSDSDSALLSTDLRADRAPVVQESRPCGMVADLVSG